MNAFLMDAFGLSFLAPPWLLLLVLVPVLAWWQQKRGWPTLRTVTGDVLAHSGAPNQALSRPPWIYRIPRILKTLSLVALILALAGPRQHQQIPQDLVGIDILFAIDTSSSMVAEDMDPQNTRLGLALAQAQAFLAERKADRFALVTFARYPDLRCPLTRDHAAFTRFVERVTPVQRNGPEDATGIGTALARSAKALMTAKDRQRVVILLTDGEENVATSRTPSEIAPIHAAQLLADLEVPVHAIAVGQIDARGDQEPVDTRQIQEIADLTGGTYSEAEDGDALAEIHARIAELETSRISNPQFHIRDLWPPLLIAALVLLALGGVLELTRTRVLP